MASTIPIDSAVTQKHPIAQPIVLEAVDTNLPKPLAIAGVSVALATAVMLILASLVFIFRR